MKAEAQGVEASGIHCGSEAGVGEAGEGGVILEWMGSDPPGMWMGQQPSLH